jgi:predicted naringenin-chalcone synthase
MAATREVMRQYGNTRSSSVFLVMDEMRRTSAKLGLRTSGEGLQWGMLIAFGPGLTLETMLLRALPSNHTTGTA